MMAEELLNLQITGQARIAYATLGEEDRRIIDGWFDHLRNWNHDEFIRTHSQRLEPDEDTYVFQAHGDFMIAFALVEKKAVVFSLFHKEALRPFALMAERSTP